MEQARISNTFPSPCEKIFKAFNIIPAFKAMRRISDRPQSPMVKTAAISLVPGADPAAKANSVVPIIIGSTVVHPTPPNGKGKLNEKMDVQGKKASGQAVKDTENSKVIVVQIHGQEAKTPNNSYQVKPVPKVETVSPAKPLVEQGQQKVDSRERANRTVSNSGDRFTDFINRTLFKRSTSDVGKSSSSGHDGAQSKKRISSNVGGGKSISFKK